LDEEDGDRQTALARQALAVWPDCADAYVLLAGQAPTRQEALRLYEQGVAAGERAIGPQAFRDAVGHFGGLLPTRPYLRARLGLARSLWAAGRRGEAVQHLQALLRLNPDDHQGVRYTLAAFLLALDRDDDLARLLERYPGETSATWAYTRALLAFRHGGDTPQARQLLQQAKQTNKDVPEYLLGRKSPPEDRPAYYRLGDESEALNYAGGFLAGWRDTPGALAWVRDNDEQVRQRQAETPRPRGPLGFVKRWLADKLPQGTDVWQADARPLANALRIAGDSVRPWLVLVTSGTDDRVLAHGLSEEEPSPALLWDTLVQAMQNPAAGQPHRPAELQVRPGSGWESLRPHVEGVGIRLVVADQLEPLGGVLRGMSEHLAGRPRPGLLDMPGVGPEQVRSFYEAAAYFHGQAPWRQVGYEAAIQVECGKYGGGPWYAVLMGQSGLVLGLALYEELGTVRQVWEEELSHADHARQSVVTTVSFAAEAELPLADVEAARTHGWAVAGPDAYPAVFHKERGLCSRPPLAWELELLEGCLRAVPDFVRRRRQDDPTREEVASGELRLVLSWVPEEGA
jgi:hypothetical protein